MKKILLLFLLTICLFAGTVEEAKKLFNNKQYKEALVIFNEHPDNPEAQYYLGLQYLSELGTQKNAKKAFQLVTSSSDNNYTRSTSLMAYMHRYGVGTPKDIEKAIYWYQKDQDYSSIADLYYIELKDYKQALHYYLLHYKSDFYKLLKETDAKLLMDVPSRIGKMYLEGKGTNKDVLTGLKYIHEAAEQGNTDSMLTLGRLFERGEAVKKDINISIEWYHKAIKNGDNEGYSLLADLYYFELKDYTNALKVYKDYIKVTDGKNKKELIRVNYKIALLLEKIQQYKEAYQYYLNNVKLGYLQGASSLYVLVYNKDTESLKDKQEEALSWLIKASDKKRNKDKESLENAQIRLFLHYKGRTFEFDKAIKLATEAYAQGNDTIGCHLAYYYSNPRRLNKTDNSDLNYTKAYNLSNEIIVESNDSESKIYCYETLASLFSSGKYVPKNISQSIKHFTTMFNIDEFKAGKSFWAESIADNYLKIKDYKNAEKWYSTTYDLTGDKKFLTIVSQDKKAALMTQLLIQNNIIKENDQKLFPIINNINDMSQILAQSGGTGIEILSTSQKSINIYDDKTWKLLKELRGWIGAGSLGQVTQMVYDDNKSLLYCASINSIDELSKNDMIKIFNINTGKIVDIIKNKQILMPTFLSISEDGKYLIAVNQMQSSLHIIDTKTHIEQKYHTDNKFLGGMIYKKEKDYIVSILDDKNFLNIYSLNKKYLINRYRINKKILGFSRQNLFIQNRPNEINFMDFTGQIIKTVTLDKPMNFQNITISPDNQYLVLTTKNKVNLYSLKNNKIIKSFYIKHQIYNAYISYENILYIKTLKNITAYNIVTKTFTQLFSKILSPIDKVFFKDMQLFITKKDAKMTDTFDFQSLNLIANKKINEKPLKADKKSSQYSIKINDNNSTLEILSKNKTTPSVIINFRWTTILNYKIIDDKYIVLALNDLQLLILNMRGRVLVNLNGFSAVQKHIDYFQKYLFTFGSDNIVHIWDIDQLDNFNKQKEKINRKVAKLLIDTIDNTEQKIDLINLVKHNNIDAFINSLDDSLSSAEKHAYKLFLLKKKMLFPMASLYIKDKDWVVYNKKGLFASSKNGKDLIKYHLNQGLHKEAKIIENDQIFEKFYRPDLIKKILAKEKVDEKIDVRSIILNVKPPEVTIVDKTLKGKKDLELRYKICDAGSGVSNISMIRNGISSNLYNSRGFTIESRTPTKDKCEIYKNIITLEPGKNTITVKAFDKEKIISNISDKIIVEANYKIEKKPNLHFVSLAVSNYRDEALKLKYPVSDVIAVKKVIEKKSKNLFSDIYTYALHDKNVTKENLGELFTKISKKVAVNDVFIMYIAGHGITSIKDGLFYFLPQDIIDTSTEGLVKNAISVNDIKNQLRKIAANKSLILIDTCDSGSFVEHVSRGLEQRMAAERLAHATGRNYIVASSKNQAALEGYKNHGVFTFTVLDAFDKAYFGNSSTLMVSSLATFIQTEVPKITSEKFHYEQFPQKYLNGDDFPIGEK